MNLNELTYNTFSIDDYERFLLEVFNVNLASREDILYLIDDSYQSKINSLYYYGSYMDDEFNDIELYVIRIKIIQKKHDIFALKALK